MACPDRRNSALRAVAQSGGQCSETAPEEQQQARQIMEVLGSAMYVGLLTVEGALTYANQAALDAVGAKLDDFQGKPFDMTPWWDYSTAARHRLREAIRAAAGGDSSRFDILMRAKDGRVLTIDFSLHPVLDLDGRPAYLIAAGRDITEHRQAEQALRLTQFAIDRSSNAFMHLDAEGRLCYVNDAACRLLGHTREDLLAMTFSAIDARKAPENWSTCWSKVRAQGALRLETSIRHRDGRAIPVEVSASHIAFENRESCFVYLSDLSERKAAEGRIHYLAHFDELTGLANRGLFIERLRRYAKRARDTQSKLAVILVDVERVKTINTTLGRQAGEELLRQIAERFVSTPADHERFARIDGSHFALAIPQAGSVQDVARSIESGLLACFQVPFEIAGTEIRMTARFGVGMYPDDGVDAEQLFKHAEAALMKAKATGDKYLFYTQQMSARTAYKLTLENQLRQALEREEFVLHYQPKVSLATQRIVGVEALIRWNSPELGLVAPGEFIPLLEETGLILDVGAWALRQAVQQHRQWAEQGLHAPRVAVNVSAIQLRKRNFVSTVQQALEEGIDPSAVELEITESVVMEAIQENIDKLAAIRGMGVSIAIDDFGTGYSSLAYLTKLPVQALKIDRSFVSTMLEEADVMTLVSSIVSLAHSLRLKVIAEGVENRAQMQALHGMGCDQMQGYVFSKPLPNEELVALLGPAAPGPVVTSGQQ